MARMAKRLTPNVTIYTDGAEDLAQQTVLAAVNDDIKVESRRISLLEKGTDSSVVVHFEKGEKITEGFLVRVFLLARIAVERSTLTLPIGAQTQERNQRAICPPAGARADRSRRY